MTDHTGAPPTVAVVVPCYRVTDTILDVLRQIPAAVSTVVCVDDACPDGSGTFIADRIRDARVHVVRHERNQGVGGATMTGYRAATALGATILVKIDGDGQMDPKLLTRFVQPIVEGRADYTKGNRFYRPESIRSMPVVRLFGNAALSFLTKLSTGYWHLFDPTNGYTAIHAKVLDLVPIDKIDRRYFFETDLLFRLGTVRAVVCDIPMDACYRGEASHLSPIKVVVPFLAKHVANLGKRFGYTYFLRDFSLASVLIIGGGALVLAGLGFGVSHWVESIRTGTPATAGTVMLAALPILLGLHALLGALGYDIANVPKAPIHHLLE